MADNKIKLSDKRNLSFFEYGDRDGKPVFYFHGSGISSAAYAENIGNIAAENGIRLIAPDRPGVGSSDYKPDRRLLNWPKDMEELAHKLGIREFSIVSESGGSAYAYACAYMIPERINNVAIVSGLCPLNIKYLWEGLSLKNRMTLSLLKKSPAGLLTKMFTRIKEGVEGDAEAFFTKAARRAPDADRKLLSDPDFGTVIKTAFKTRLSRVIRAL